jgi:hypothetical protein
MYKPAPTLKAEIQEAIDSGKEFVLVRKIRYDLCRRIFTPDTQVGNDPPRYIYSQKREIIKAQTDPKIQTIEVKNLQLISSLDNSLKESLIILQESGFTLEKKKKTYSKNVEIVIVEN